MGLSLGAVIFEVFLEFEYLFFQQMPGQQRSQNGQPKGRNDKDQSGLGTVTMRLLQNAKQDQHDRRMKKIHGVTILAEKSQYAGAEKARQQGLFGAGGGDQQQRTGRQCNERIPMY